MSEFKRPTIHYTQFTDLPPDHAFFHEWRAYRRELPRLLAEGHEGKVALVKGDQLVGVFETEAEAEEDGYERFGVDATFMIQPIQEQEPVLFVPWFRLTEPVLPLPSDSTGPSREQAMQWEERPAIFKPGWDHLNQAGRPTIHYTQSSDLPPDDVHYHEWKAYRRELPRLLAEGREGQYALLKGDQLVGVFDTDEEAENEGEERFGFNEDFLIQPIRENEPEIRILRWGW